MLHRGQSLHAIFLQCSVKVHPHRIRFLQTYACSVPYGSVGTAAASELSDVGKCQSVESYDGKGGANSDACSMMELQ